MKHPVRPYYQDDLVELYHGDCRHLKSYLRRPGAIICDPPYGATKNAWDSALRWPEFWGVVGASGAPLLAMFAQGRFGAEAIVRARPWLPYAYSWVWAKDRVTGFLNAGHMPLRDHEDIHVFRCVGRAGARYNPQFTQGEPLHKRGARRKPLTTYGIQRDGNSDEGSTEKHPRSVLHFEAVVKAVYPCEKPIALLRYLVATYTNPGDLVCDPFAGSGTTLVAAKALGRRAVGVEATLEGCRVAAERLSQCVLDLGGVA